MASQCRPSRLTHAPLGSPSRSLPPAAASISPPLWVAASHHKTVNSHHQHSQPLVQHWGVGMADGWYWNWLQWTRLHPLVQPWGYRYSTMTTASSLSSTAYPPASIGSSTTPLVYAWVRYLWTRCVANFLWVAVGGTATDSDSISEMLSGCSLCAATLNMWLKFATRPNHAAFTRAVYVHLQGAQYLQHKFWRLLYSCRGQELIIAHTTWVCTWQYSANAVRYAACKRGPHITVAPGSRGSRCTEGSDSKTVNGRGEAVGQLYTTCGPAWRTEWPRRSA